MILKFVRMTLQSDLEKKINPIYRTFFIAIRLLSSNSANAADESGTTTRPIVAGKAGATGSTDPATSSEYA